MKGDLFLDRRERRRLWARLASISAATAMLFPSSARADEWSEGVGLFVGYAFGPRPGVTWGAEAFATRIAPVVECSNVPRSGFGPLAQFALIGFHDPRFTFAAQGGKELELGGTSITGELGITYRLGDDPGPGVHLGISPAYSFFDTFARGELLLDEYSFGVGGRLLPTYGDFGKCFIGRPLRTEQGLAHVREHGRRSRERSRATTVRPRFTRAGRAWERDAQYECASVPAFVDLALALIACSAPPELVHRALDAASDEILHAELCARLATRHLGEIIRPELPAHAPRLPLAGAAGLARLAVESWTDGCLGEGAAAKQAVRAGQVAAHSETRSVLQRIATDEARHAELGWSVLGWALEKGGGLARDQVRALRDFEPSPALECDEGEQTEALGRLPASEKNAITERNLFDSRRRLDRLISSAW